MGDNLHKKLHRNSKILHLFRTSKVYMWECVLSYHSRSWFGYRVSVCVPLLPPWVGIPSHTAYGHEKKSTILPRLPHPPFSYSCTFTLTTTPRPSNSTLGSTAPAPARESEDLVRRRGGAASAGGFQHCPAP